MLPGRRHTAVSAAVKQRSEAGEYVAFLRPACGQAGPDSALLREYLWACADELGSRLRSDRAIVQAAEYARAWGASLAGRMEPAASAGAGDSIADDVLLAVVAAVAMILSPGA